MRKYEREYHFNMHNSVKIKSHTIYPLSCALPPDSSAPPSLAVTCGWLADWWLPIKRNFSLETFTMGLRGKGTEMGVMLLAGLTAKGCRKGES